MPLAAFATLDGQRLQLRAAWGDAEQAAPLLRAEAVADVQSLADAAALGLAVATELQRQGAR